MPQYKYYTVPAEKWTAAQCKKVARCIRKDGCGTPYPFRGYIGCNQWGQRRYNGGCIRDGEWYDGEIVELPEVPAGFKIVYVSTWGYRLIAEGDTDERYSGQ